MGHVISSRRAQQITIDGKSLIIFSSNDYLGLSHHPEVLKVAAEAADKFGLGTGGAPGTSGTTSIHLGLANEIARFKNRQEAVIFPSGYAANIALHQSLAGDDTIFFSDERNHPSTADGIRLSGCAKQVYRHLDFDHLETLLKQTKQPRRIVTTCSVFTIDGAICPLNELMTLKNRYGFLLILDEAHGTGCLGKNGRGLEEMYELDGAADFIMGTFSKALGSQGGFLAYSKEAEKLLSLPLRAYEYSTSISAPLAAASLKALSLLESRPELVAAMQANITRIYESLQKDGCELNGSGRHIVNIYFKNQEDTLKAAGLLFENGYLVIPINISDRWGLRLTAMATHTHEEISAFCHSLAQINRQLHG